MSWIQPRDAELLKNRFASEMKGQVTLNVFTQDDRIVVPGRAEVPYAREIVELLQEVAGLSDKLQVKVFDADRDKEQMEKHGIQLLPAIMPVDAEHKDYGIRFYGLPSGYDFVSLLEAIFSVSQGDSHLDDSAVRQRVETLDSPIRLRVFVTPT